MVFTMAQHHVVLVPGFFGFGNLGGLTYFVGVRQALERSFDRRGLDVLVVEVPTLPTASIRHRAARVLETLAEVSQGDDAPVHIIGHSTGGLDARLAIAPTASLPTSTEFGAYERVRTLVTVSAPHFGTPLATAFGSAMGKPLLRLVALATTYVLQYGRLPLSVILKIGEVVTKLDDRIGLKNTIADELYANLLSDMSPERRRQISEFIEGITNDQSLIFQLTPAGCDLLNASTADPDQVHYGCVVTRARPPGITAVLRHRHNVYAQSLYAVYALLYTLTGRGKPDQFPIPVELQRQALRRGYGKVPNHQDNDGVVPTLSQVWGEVIFCAEADHLDVVGHYGREDPTSPDADWLPTNSGFGSGDFEKLWDAIADFVTRDLAQGPDVGRRQNVGQERTSLDALEASLNMEKSRSEPAQDP